MDAKKTDQAAHEGNCYIQLLIYPPVTQKSGPIYHKADRPARQGTFALLCARFYFKTSKDSITPDPPARPPFLRMAAAFLGVCNAAHILVSGRSVVFQNPMNFGYLRSVYKSDGLPHFSVFLTATAFDVARSQGIQTHQRDISALAPAFPVHAGMGYHRTPQPISISNR